MLSRLTLCQLTLFMKMWSSKFILRVPAVEIKWFRYFRVTSLEALWLLLTDFCWAGNLLVTIGPSKKRMLVFFWVYLALWRLRSNIPYLFTHESLLAPLLGYSLFLCVSHTEKQPCHWTAKSFRAHVHPLRRGIRGAILFHHFDNYENWNVY